LAVLTALLALVASHAAASAPPAFKIYFERAGAYRLDFEDLAAAGLEDPLSISARGWRLPGS
jgi:hypothetical protein